MQPQIDLNEIVKEFKAIDFTSLVLSTGLLYNLVLVSILLHAGEDTGTTYTVGTAGTVVQVVQLKMSDEIDRRVINELQLNARLSYAELGRRVGLTTPAVIERVRKLEDAGIITGYRAEIDPAKVGLPITAFIRMSITGVDYSHIIEVAQESREILECHRGAGGDSFIMRVVVESVEHLQQVIDRLTPYGITTTTIVLSSPVRSRTINIEPNK